MKKVFVVLFILFSQNVGAGVVYYDKASGDILGKIKGGSSMDYDPSVSDKIDIPDSHFIFGIDSRYAKVENGVVVLKDNQEETKIDIDNDIYVNQVVTLEMMITALDSIIDGTTSQVLIDKATTKKKKISEKKKETEHKIK